MDPEIAEKIDIGLPPPRELAKSTAYKRSEFIRELKNDKSLEKAARNNTRKNLYDITLWYTINDAC